MDVLPLVSGTLELGQDAFLARVPEQGLGIFHGHIKHDIGQLRGRTSLACEQVSDLLLHEVHALDEHVKGGCVLGVLHVQPDETLEDGGETLASHLHILVPHLEQEILEVIGIDDLVHVALKQVAYREALARTGTTREDDRLPILLSLAEDDECLVQESNHLLVQDVLMGLATLVSYGVKSLHGFSY